MSLNLSCRLNISVTILQLYEYILRYIYLNLSGNGATDFVNISHSVTYIDNSPFSVRLIVPLAPIISPIYILMIFYFFNIIWK
jgi:hypothetical protein